MNHFTYFLEIAKQLMIKTTFFLLMILMVPTQSLAITQEGLNAQGIYFVTLGAELSCNTSNSTINLEGSAVELINQLPGSAREKFDSNYPRVEALRSEYEDQSNKNDIPWEIFAALHYREATNGPDQTVLNGQPYGASNSDGNGVISTRDQGYRIASEIIRGNSARYGVNAVTKTEPLSIQDLAKIAISYNRGVLYKNAYGQEEGPWYSPYVASYLDEDRIDMVFPGPVVNGVRIERSVAGQKEERLGFIPFLLLLYEKTGADTANIAGADVQSINNDSTSVCKKEGAVFGADLSNIVYYSQRDPRWSDYPYPFDGDADNAEDNNIRTSGCGPTTMAMVAATLLEDTTITPEVMAEKNIAGGHRVSSGTSWSAFTEILPTYGLIVDQIDNNDINRLSAELNSGALAIGSFNESSPFTNGGHILVIRAVTSEGKFLVADPNDGNVDSSNYLRKSQTEWDSSIISGTSKGIFIVRLAS